MKLRLKAIKYGAQTGKWLPENQHHSGRLGNNTQLRPMMVDEALVATLDTLERTGLGSPANTVAAMRQARIVSSETGSRMFGKWLWQTVRPLFQQSIFDALLRKQPRLSIHTPVSMSSPGY